MKSRVQVTEPSFSSAAVGGAARPNINLVSWQRDRLLRGRSPQEQDRLKDKHSDQTHKSSTLRTRKTPDLLIICQAEPVSELDLVMRNHEIRQFQFGLNLHAAFQHIRYETVSSFSPSLQSRGGV
ncbi:hypothetical protein C0J45_12286 [Silurus meridionalis]|uniref:Uncharacterized protein n=1 Tax=Silurus meridionalis TaxID=175797 RepID=A0A8T0AXQ8_SILME|nr:hypothetical protein HF521_004223 [Silurus meridionalis]KAI5096977.1 hypothetical protein C0J45_12286 [Silurus meridionalis]